MDTPLKSTNGLPVAAPMEVEWGERESIFLMWSNQIKQRIAIGGQQIPVLLRSGQTLTDNNEKVIAGHSVVDKSI